MELSRKFVSSQISHQMLTTDDEGQWRDLVPEHKNIFGSFAYAMISQMHTGNKARLIVMRNEDAQVMHPVFLRPISRLPFAPQSLVDHFDIGTPEYSGPTGTHTIDMQSASQFREYYENLCRKNNIVSEFGHYNPWSANAWLSDPTCLSVNREIVFVDLTMNESALWNKSFSHTCRRTITKAQKDGIRVFQIRSKEDVCEFYRVYKTAMIRIGALQQYYFSLDYFMSILELMPNNALFFLAELRDRIVGANLVLYDDKNMYAHLGGSEQSKEVSGVAARLDYESIKWGQEHGKSRYVLGGGYKPDDGVFKYKCHFSPLRAKLLVQKKIHMPDRFETLCRLWSEHANSDSSLVSYFPPYRSPLEDDVDTVA